MKSPLTLLLLAAALLRPVPVWPAPALEPPALETAWTDAQAWYDRPVAWRMLRELSSLQPPVGMGIEPGVLARWWPSDEADGATEPAGVAEWVPPPPPPPLDLNLALDDSWEVFRSALASLPVTPDRTDTFKGRVAQAREELVTPVADDTAEYILNMARDPTLAPWQVMGLADEVLTPVGLRRLVFTRHTLLLVVAVVAVAAARELLAYCMRRASFTRGRRSAPRLGPSLLNRRLATRPAAARALLDD